MRVFSTEHDIKAFRCDVMFAGSKRSCHVVCCVCDCMLSKCDVVCGGRGVIAV